ncbi:hypothetical protein U3516DRAFT_744884 [Neocallimastix sp. 'constans']
MNHIQALVINISSDYGLNLVAESTTECSFEKQVPSENSIIYKIKSDSKNQTILLICVGIGHMNTNKKFI